MIRILIPLEINTGLQIIHQFQLIIPINLRLKKIKNKISKESQTTDDKKLIFVIILFIIYFKII